MVKNSLYNCIKLTFKLLNSKLIWMILTILITISSYMHYKDPGETFDNYETAELVFEIFMIIVICNLFIFL